MIKRIYIDGYKSLREVELDNLGSLVVFFGANASGKSNLLDALDLLGRLSRDDTLLQAFQRHRGSRASRPLPVRHFFSQGDDATSTMTFEVDLELEEARVERLNKELREREEREGLKRSYTMVTYRNLRYRLSLHHDAQSRAIEVVDEQLYPITETGAKHLSVKPFIGRTPDAASLSVKLERQSHPRTFPLPRPRTLLSEIRDLVNHPHLVATAQELAAASIYYIEPTRMRSEVSDVEARDPGPNGEAIASFYYWLQRSHPVRFKNLQINLRRLIPGFENLRISEATDGFLDLWVQEAHRGEFPAALLSEGTLRLLCLLGILVSPEPPSVVGYEEPENGVHPGRLSEMLEMLIVAANRGQTQFLITTHSPEVLDTLSGFPLFRAARVGARTTFCRSNALPLLRLIESRQSLGDVPSSAGGTVGQRLVRGDLG